MYRFAHISDLHLSPLPPVSWRQLCNKRLIGWLNWRHNRQAAMGSGALDAVLRHIHSQAPSHLAISGDMVNLALPQEFQNARAKLASLGNPHDISLVLGNHDAYVPGAFAQACAAFAPWIAGDGGDNASDEGGALGLPAVSKSAAAAKQNTAGRAAVSALPDGTGRVAVSALPDESGGAVSALSDREGGRANLDKIAAAAVLSSETADMNAGKENLGGNGFTSLAAASAMPVMPSAADFVGRGRRGVFPYMRIRGEIAFIGASSAIAMPPFCAAGFFGARQAAALAELLRQAGEKGLFRVVMIHHPPLYHAAPWRKALLGIGRFQAVIAAQGAELVLHGHTHLPSLSYINAAPYAAAGKDGGEASGGEAQRGGGAGRAAASPRSAARADNQAGASASTKCRQIPVVGAASAAQQFGGSKPPAGYNLFSVSRGAQGQWQCELERFALADADNAIRRTAHKQL